MRLGERRQRHRCLVDPLHGRPGRQADLLVDRRRDVADQADVGDGRRVAVTEQAGRLAAGEMTFERRQRLDRPVPPPGVLLAVAQVELAVEIAAHPWRDQRMALAGDHQRQSTHPGAAERIGRQQRRVGIGLVEIVDDRERLEQHGAVVDHQRRQRHLRIDLAIGVSAMRVRIEIDEYDFGRHALEVERDPHPEARQRSPEGEELHGVHSSFFPSPLVGKGGGDATASRT
ncbi:hypothetical protein chiPu_0028479, partial [Chiloscyllium punctatum]|nr:hypothetical protein [Chiloscyllium punctatum]